MAKNRCKPQTAKNLKAAYDALHPSSQLREGFWEMLEIICNRKADAQEVDMAISTVREVLRIPEKGT